MAQEGGQEVRGGWATATLHWNGSKLAVAGAAVKETLSPAEAGVLIRIAGEAGLKKSRRSLQHGWFWSPGAHEHVMKCGT